MTRRRLLLGGVLAALLYLSWLARAGPLAVHGPPVEDGFVRMAGAVHVHTTFSDGGGTPEDVARAAKRAGLGFVVVTDHNNLDAKPAEGYRDGILLIVGVEVSTVAGHVLGLGVPDPAYRFSGDPRDALDDIRDLGGVAFAAHPVSQRRDFVWTGWGLPGGWGVELFNGDSQWRAADWARLLRGLAIYAVNPTHALLSCLTPPTETMNHWTGMLAERDAAVIVGADAHQRAALSKRRAVPLPSYESVFALAKNHLVLDRPLSGDAAPDARAIVTALARGRSYVGIDALAPADDFSFVATSGDRRRTMGDSVPLEEHPTFRVRVRAPKGARATLIRDRETVAESEAAAEEGLTLSHEAAGPGAYRVEVRVAGHDVPWIVSNPIYLFSPVVLAERAARAIPPPETAPPEARQLIDDFRSPTSFGAERDDASAMSSEVIEAGAGPNGAPAARLRCKLGVPSPSRPSVWCALVSRQPRDLGGRAGLVLSIRGDGVYRIWVQVRDRNPASANGGTEWWFASIRTSREWRRVAVPFASLRSLNPKTDGRVDLDKVAELVFVLDQGAVKPGTAGTIWIADLGAY